jgi:predicted DnaQ family exonuclease/DinG family helicase
VLPTLGSYGLQRLAVEVGYLPARAHRALDDAEAAAALCCSLVGRAERLRVDTLEGALQLAPLAGRGLAFVFEEALRRRARNAFAEAPPASARGALGPLAARLGRRADLEGTIAALFSAGGPLGAAFERFEARMEQVQMAEAVDQVFTDGGALVVEAGTGTGKSLAYLIPALRAAARGRRVLISTYTTNLQEQLARRDLPGLMAALGLDLSVAVLKGRQNYLCPRRWHLLRLTAQAPAEARFALRTLVWREQTETGDRAELGLGGDEAALWSRVCAEDETCTSRRCASVRGGCYLERARQAAERADLVVVNHALLLADARSRNRLLPDRPLLVVDEAHHLEEVAARTFGVRLEAGELRRSLHRAAHGALAQQALQAGLIAEVAQLRDEAERASVAADETFAALGRVMPPPEARGFEDRARVSDVTRGGPEWLAAELGAERLRDGLAGTTAAAERLLAHGADDDVAAETEAAVRELRDADAALERAVHAYRPSEICWLALEQGSEYPVLQTEPAHAGGYIARLVVAPRDATVFTSATLSVGGSLDFVVDRFGLADRAVTLRLGSPFHLRQQALLVMPEGLLDPYERGFIGQAAEIIGTIGRALGGRTLVLFTAHTMLREVRAQLGTEVGDVVPLAQGVDGSRRQLLDQFAQGGAVLLGTAAFWEGIDLPGDLLRCVIVAKLPFPVPDDPVVAGRAERYEDPFRDYHLPVAALRLQQGFGRLIRSREDRGAVVVLDRRISTRAYGEVLLASLPPCALARPELDEIAPTVAAWCAG